MPVDFLTEEQQRRYGRYAGEPSPAQLERYFHLDDTDRGLIARCRGDHTRLGFAVQLGTVRFLGTFLADPSEVPPGVVAYLARQLGIADTGGLEALRGGRDAPGPRRRDPSPLRLPRLPRGHRGRGPVPLARQPGLGQCRTPQRPLRPGHGPAGRTQGPAAGGDVLARLVAQVRDQAASRLWRTLARALKPRQAARLETLLVADERSRQSPLERLRRAPTRVSVAGLVEALAATPGDPSPGREPHRPVRRAARAGPGPGPVRRRGTGASHRPDAAAPPPRDPPGLRQGPGDHGARRRPGPARPVDHRDARPRRTRRPAATPPHAQGPGRRRVAAPRGVPRPARPRRVPTVASATPSSPASPATSSPRPWPRSPTWSGRPTTTTSRTCGPATARCVASCPRSWRRSSSRRPTRAAPRPRRSASSRPSRGRSGPT